jgi:solute carrier family 25 carnitine/acylcarnitine transporter 20/29
MDYIKGSIAGTFGCIVSYPFDTIRIRAQNNIRNNTNLPLLKHKKIICNFKDLYSGVNSAILGIALEKSIVFGTYSLSRKYLNTQSNIFNIFTSGRIAGFCCSFIVSPYEQIKILMQMNKDKHYRDYINKKNLNMKFIFNGLSCTFSRETPGFGIYFSCYELLKKYSDNNNIAFMQNFINGGLSGSLAWIFIYPQDRIKTYKQTYNTSLKEAISQIFKSKNLYRGFSWTLMRAFILHAGTFSVYESLSI